LTNEVTAYAAVEEFLDTRDCGGGGERCVDFYVAVFVLEKSKLVGLG
jgi:hypothetical protein